MQDSADFVYEASATRVVFGVGSLQHLERELAAMGAQRALVLCTPEQREMGESIVARLGRSAVGLFDRAVMHVPIEVAREGRDLARRCRADCAVAVGGGSTIGLGKAIALESDLAILAVPTTYAGSEMTPVFGITEGGIKRTGTDRRVLPKTVLYDPALTLSLPAALSITSGINAIAHAAEGLYAQNANPVTSLLAEEGIRSMASALPAIAVDPRDRQARSAALYGAWMCGTVLGNVGMALHHKLCHTLGGSFNLPHAQTHTAVLPHALAYNAPFVPQAMRRIARALNASDAARGVYDLALGMGERMALRDLGMEESDLDRAADLASANPYWNPRPLERAALRELLQAAFDGAPPRTADLRSGMTH
ncbi:maleylacetate reductase [Variovorax sp. RT4R15]|uniref:maleylacetate reductase n=1 Tax=Variovorax sp. RT4R15 TaxID=3443737 RepID=UPI003F471BF1